MERVQWSPAAATRRPSAGKPALSTKISTMSVSSLPTPSLLSPSSPSNSGVRRGDEAWVGLGVAAHRHGRPLAVFQGRGRPPGAATPRLWRWARGKVGPRRERAPAVGGAGGPSCGCRHGPSVASARPGTGSPCGRGARAVLDASTHWHGRRPRRRVCGGNAWALQCGVAAELRQRARGAWICVDYAWSGPVSQKRVLMVLCGALVAWCGLHHLDLRFVWVPRS